MARPKGSKNKVVTTPVMVPVAQNHPNTDFEEAMSPEVKIIQCPYMGPDADDTEAYIQQNLIGTRRWNADNANGSDFSIGMDSMY